MAALPDDTNILSFFGTIKPSEPSVAINKDVFSVKLTISTTNLSDEDENEIIQVIINGCLKVRFSWFDDVLYERLIYK